MTPKKPFELVLGAPVLPTTGQPGNRVGPWTDVPFIHCAAPTEPTKVLRATCVGEHGAIAWLRHKPLRWDAWPSVEELEEMQVAVGSPELLQMFREQLGNPNYSAPRVMVSLGEGDSVSFFSNAFVKFAGGPYDIEEVWSGQQEPEPVFEPDLETVEVEPDRTMWRVLEIDPGVMPGVIAKVGKAELRLREDRTVMFKRRLLRSETGAALKFQFPDATTISIYDAEVSDLAAGVRVTGWSTTPDGALVW